jgi:hypothetical protein
VAKETRARCSGVGVGPAGSNAASIDGGRDERIRGDAEPTEVAWSGEVSRSSSDGA